MTARTTPFPNISLPLTQARSTPGGYITQPWLQLLQSLWARTGAAQGGNAVPTGGMMDFAGTSPPTGWLACDGSAISRVTYAALFSVVGTMWGVGDGVTTFNLPPGDVFYQGGVASSVGQTGGSASLNLTVGQLPPHTHVVDDPGHTHTASVGTGSSTKGVNSGGPVVGLTNSSLTGIDLEYTGDGDPIDILPPYATVLKIIKT